MAASFITVFITTLRNEREVNGPPLQGMGMLTAPLPHTSKAASYPIGEVGLLRPPSPKRWGIPEVLAHNTSCLSRAAAYMSGNSLSLNIIFVLSVCSELLSHHQQTVPYT